MVGIIALGRLREVPVYVGDKVVEQEQMTIGWSADHRVVDGATVAKAAKVAEGWLQDVERVKEDV